MEMISVESTNIKAIGFQENTIVKSSFTKIGTVRVEFTHGAIYDYKNVPQSLYDDVVKANSVGKFFYANIKNNFNFIKIGG